jgi:hypothetical protein
VRNSLQLLEQIGLGAEMAEMPVALFRLLQHFLPHFGAVVAVERVAFDISRSHVLAAEDVLERLLHRRGASAGRAGHGDDGVPTGHAFTTSSGQRNRPRRAEQRRVAALEPKL